MADKITNGCAIAANAKEQDGKVKEREQIETYIRLKPENVVDIILQPKWLAAFKYEEMERMVEALKASMKAREAHA